MTNWIVLACPTCGASLRVSGESAQFSCDHCGNKFLLEQKAQDIHKADRGRLVPLVIYAQQLQQWLKAGQYDIFVHELLEEEIHSQRLLLVNVEYQNEGIENLSCRRNQWVLYDAEGYSYDAATEAVFFEEKGRIPLNGERFLNPGMHLRGWIAFKIPPSASPERVQFLTGFLRTTTVDFLLKS